MPHLTDRELFARLKNGIAPAPIYFLYGAESWFVRQAVRRLCAQAEKGSFPTMNLRRFSGEKLDFGELEDACDQLPMMAERRYVTVCDLDVEKLPKESLERLMALIDNPNETTTLALYMTGVTVELKRSAKYRKLAEAAAKTGVVCEFPLQDKLTLKRALCEKARGANVQMEMSAANALVERCSQSYAILSNELEKLLAYRAGGEIVERDVEECCTRSVDASAFDLAKSLLSRRYDRAFGLLDELFTMRQEAVAILGALSLAFADLYRAKCAVAAGKSADQAAADFRYPKNRLFAVKNAFRDARGFSREQLAGCIRALARADRALKTSKMDDRLALERMLGEMIVAGQRRG